MSDIYADFGVTGATMSEPSEGYNAEMAALPVAVRDGDDAIVAVEDDETTGEQTGDEKVEVQINTEGEDSTDNAETNEESQEGEDQGVGFEAVGDVPEELSVASQKVADAEVAFNDMVADAAQRGLAPEKFQAMAQEYDEKGSLSPESYAELAKVGYTKAFIDSYIAGQTAQANAYVSSVINYAGGQAKFDAIVSHLGATDPSAATALVQAIEGRQLDTVKALINLAAKSHVKTFGKQEARTLTKQAKPVAPKAPAKDGFESRQDMIKAMSDRRYGVDAAYTRSVEQKVINSPF